MSDDYTLEDFVRGMEVKQASIKDWLDAMYGAQIVVPLRPAADHPFYPELKS